MPSDGCGDAGDVGFLKNADVGSPIFPTDPEDLAETSLVVLLQGLQVSAVGGPAVCPVEQSGQNYSSVDREFCLGLDVAILKDPLPQPSKSCTGTPYAVVNLCVNDSSRGKKTAKVGKLIHISQDVVFHVNCGGLGGCVRSWLVQDLSFLHVNVKSQESVSSGKSIQDVLEVQLRMSN